MHFYHASGYYISKKLFLRHLATQNDKAALMHIYILAFCLNWSPAVHLVAGKEYKLKL